MSKNANAAVFSSLRKPLEPYYMSGTPRRPRAQADTAARTALTDCQLHRLRVHRRVVSFCIAAHYFSLTRCRPKPRSKRSAVANLHCSHTECCCKLHALAARPRNGVLIERRGDGVPWRSRRWRAVALDVRESIADGVEVG